MKTSAMERRMLAGLEMVEPVGVCWEQEQEPLGEIRRDGFPVQAQ